VTSATPTTNQLDLPYRLWALPTPGGFFGPRQLASFTSNQLGPYWELRDSYSFILDFSRVRVWDVAALLWLVICFNHYKEHGLRFRLRLPEAEGDMSDGEADACLRSGDFLRRWRFDDALRNICDPQFLLIPEQADYFQGGERKFYKPRQVLDPRGVLQSLLSEGLTEIMNLSDLDSLGANKRVLPVMIDGCVARFQQADVGGIIQEHCGVDRRTADFFADHLLKESLLNTLEHPDASIGLMGVSVMGASPELILAVADNGRSIQSTILDHYNEQNSTSFTIEQLGQLPDEARGDILDYATWPLVSRKPKIHGKQVGMGLTYIKRDVVNQFGGNLRLLAEGVRLTYQSTPERPDACEAFAQPWPGNLLRISLPLSAPS